MVVVRHFILVLTVLCQFVTPLKAEVEQVNSPFYGEVLFNFNQQKYFSAIVQLEKGLSQEQLENDTDEAKALLGSMYLAYGLHRNAQQLFNKILESSVDSQSRDFAWFQLAKIQFQRGYYQPAIDHLNKVSSPLAGQYEDERITLMALSLMKLNMSEQAVEVLGQQANTDDNVNYARFNLAVSLIKRAEHLNDSLAPIKASDNKNAIEMLNAISTSSKRDVESATLIDRVNLLLANQYLENKQFDLAIQYFSQVELNGRYSNQALLGLGWSAFGKSELATADAAWSELVNRDVSDLSVLEAYLAKSYLLYQLNEYSDSMANYKKAIDTYQQQLDIIDKQFNQSDFSSLIMAMVNMKSEDEIGWHWQHDVLTGPLLSRYMLTLISSHEFQESLKNYRDLLFIKKNLNRWQTNIVVFNDIVDVKTAANAEFKPKAELRLQQLSDQNNSGRIQALARKLAAIEVGEDALALASSAELEQLNQLRDINQRISNLEDVFKRENMLNKVSAYKKKNHLLAGVMKWELMTSYKVRLRALKKKLAELDLHAVETQKLEKNTRDVIKALPHDYDDQRLRLAATDERLHMAAVQVEELLLKYEHHLQSILKDKLLAIKERITLYRSQALLSVAHINDLNLSANEAAR